MYAIWSLIYFSFVLINWAQESVSKQEIVEYFHRALVFTTYSTIWFLPSLWVGAAMVFLLLRFFKIKIILFISQLFYVIGSIGYSYRPLVCNTFFGYLYDSYETIFYTLRNGIFAGFPFVAIGAYISFSSFQLSFKKAFNLTLLFSVLFICEAVFIKNQMKTNVDMGLMLFPSIYYLINWLIKFKLPSNELLVRLRNLSMLIFLSQRLFITAIPSILPVDILDFISNHPYLGILVYAGTTILFSIIIERLSLKYQKLRILW